MRYCTNCGHQLTVGRYCTNCGARVPLTPADGAEHRSDYPTAVRTSEFPPVPTAPPPPPPAGPAPPSARYPLFADTVPSGPVPSAGTPYDVRPVPARRTTVPWLVAVLALVVVALTGGALLLLGPTGDDAADASQSAHHGARADGPAGRSASPLEPADIAVPDTAPASVDEDGNQVTYQATNMLDGDPRTSWRMSGNGTGSVVTFTFDRPVTVTEVGLVNGYAKIDPPHDWYAGNRRIAVVVWAFDDGTEVEQELGEDHSLQTTAVPAVETRSVQLRLLDVTEPGEGPDGRDFTAISDVEISGTS